MSATPFWALTLLYWLHMLATVVWIGGLASLSLLVIPAARKVLEPELYARLLQDIQRRLNPLAWASLLVLVGTGLFQMSANSNYQGFLAIQDRWAVAMLVKHILFLGMAGVSAYLTWGLMPALGRAALRQARGQDTPDAVTLQQREAALARLNLLLGVLVLALTALARAS